MTNEVIEATVVDETSEPVKRFPIKSTMLKVGAALVGAAALAVVVSKMNKSDNPIPEN